MIKKRNLDNSLIQWIMTVTGLGPGIGEMFWVAPAASATSQFRSHLQNQLGVSEKIYTTPDTAEVAMIAYRNDVMLVMPGAYANTSSLTWDKNWTHIVGLGGPNVGGDYSEPNVVHYTATAQQVQVIDITANNCVFHGINWENNGAHATSIAAVKVNGYGNTFTDCAMKGCMNSTQNASANTGSLWIAGGGMYPIFKRCQIGQDVWGVRTTANQGVIIFNSSARPNGSDFIDCRILAVGDDSNCAMVRIATATSIGRGHRFENCFFSHFASNANGDSPLTRAFYMPSSAVQKDIIHLHNCIAVGITRWQDEDDEVVWGSMPVPTSAGGVALELTGD